MTSVRSPAAAGYDRRARHVLLRAIQAHAIRRPTHVWITSPGPQFRALDRGGRTGNERAFTRAIYYPVYNVPRNTGQPRIWSVRLDWGPIERRGSRYGRTVAVRVFRYSSGQRHARSSPGQYTAGQGATVPGHRIDE